jgi:CubicO group peptidase (beta-lactamase class C family)
MNTLAYSQNPIDGHMDNVTQGLRPAIAIKGRPAVRWTLNKRMEYYHVPGVSIAIIDNGKVVWAGGFGVKQAGTTDSVKTWTLFQAASISKPIAASAALHLVGVEKLSLDQDVNSYLKSWKVLKNSFTAREKVTLRRILSHSAGLTVHGFPGYSSGVSIPTLQQILGGEKPANTPAIIVDTVPGSQFRYSGGGFSVLQQLLIDMANESFPLIMKRLVLEPAGMPLSTFEQPLPDPRRQEAASGHDGGGVVLKGNWHTYPEMAAAGLWTTPTELAKWALNITDAWNGHTDKLLSRSMATQMLTLQKPPFGLGISLTGTDKAIAFSHGGSNEGLMAMLVMYPAVGKGAVVMTNANQGGLLFGEVLLSIAAEYQWPAGTQSEREVVNLSTGQLDGLVGSYSVSNPPNPPFSCEVSREGDQLFVELEGISRKSKIYASGINEFFSMNGFTIVFSRDNQGQAMKMSAGGLEAVRQLQK